MGQLVRALEHATGSKEQLRLPPSPPKDGSPNEDRGECDRGLCCNLVERLQERPKKRIGRPPLPDDDRVAQIKRVIAELATYGYRRVHAILKRQVLAIGRNPPNHKRVYG